MEDTVTERLKNAVAKLRFVFEGITDKAIERAIIIEETTKELDAMALEMEERENVLTEDEETNEESSEFEEEETEEVEQEMIIDTNPHSPTYNQQIPA